MTRETAPETAEQAARRFATSMLEKGFEVKALHTYTDALGSPTHYRIRLKHPLTGEKWIRPMHEKGSDWQLREPSFPNGKPLYRLHELAQKVDEPCWYVEGENCVDSLAKLGVLATTAGGVSSDDRADLTPIARRAVTIWPDNDKPGIDHGKRMAAKLRRLGCNVGMIDVAALGLPDGGDIIDWLKANPIATAADLAGLPRIGAAGESVSADGDESGILTRCIADVEARPVQWLWPGRIARGKVSILAGHPGLGKSQACISLAAIVSAGGVWPVNLTRCERGSVLIVSAEDDAEDTIRPRLEAAGADLARCHILDAVVQGEPNGTRTRRSFSLATDLPRLASKLAQLRDVALVIIDPVTAYLGATDSHKTAEVRAVLAALADVARENRAAVVAVSHLRKSGAGEAMLQVTGSLAFVAAARAAYIIAKDQADPARKLMLPAKNNLGEDRIGYAFRIEPVRLSSGIETSRVTWETECVTVTADEALAGLEDRGKHTAKEDAADFLRSLLAHGPMPVKWIQKEARDAGHAWMTVRRQ